MVTINVFRFFRDAAQWTRLHLSLMTELLESKGRLTIWSTTYSNGQEPYTITMILDDPGNADRAQLIATDLDRSALAQARPAAPIARTTSRACPRECAMLLLIH